MSLFEKLKNLFRKPAPQEKPAEAPKTPERLQKTCKKLLPGMQEAARRGEGREAARRRAAEDQAEVQRVREVLYLPEYDRALSELLPQLPESPPGGPESQVQPEGGKVTKEEPG